ncbi:hypothetical protein T06_16249 [Trichinella sp. T6]|nr:hypothetical protein T06_16249 [Trichinella sp. T6]
MRCILKDKKQLYKSKSSAIHVEKLRLNLIKEFNF